jgi:spermidine/putrescine transport system substrate-binding protein
LRRAPLIARYASAQARTVRVFAWAGYLNDAMLQDFERKTGIHAVYTPYDSNDTAFNQLRASAGRGFDVVQPTVDRVPGYVEYDLLQPIDERRVNADKVIPSVMQARARWAAWCRTAATSCRPTGAPRRWRSTSNRRR